MKLPPSYRSSFAARTLPMAEQERGEMDRFVPREIYVNWQRNPSDNGPYVLAKDAEARIAEKERRLKMQRSTIDSLRFQLGREKLTRKAAEQTLASAIEEFERLAAIHRGSVQAEAYEHCAYHLASRASSPEPAEEEK
jgi:uncharacterized coiled-coil protein SlyX